MKTTIQTLGVILFSATSAFAAILTGPVYNPANFHSYFLLTSSSWTVAEAEAVSLGGHLTTVNDTAENSWLVSSFSNYGGQLRALWTGLNDSAVDGVYTWASGENSLFRNWEGGQPSTYIPEDDFVHIWPSPGPRSPGQWNDHYDISTFPAESFQLYGVVEVVPEPTIFCLVSLGIAALTIRGKLK